MEKEEYKKKERNKNKGLKTLNKKSSKKVRIKQPKELFPLILTKFQKEPIISPVLENSWEAWQTFNPGVILLDGKIHFIYRAIGEDGISRLGYASSIDGFTINERIPYPIYTHRLTNPHSSFNPHSYASGGSFGGAEDPRITRVNNEERLYMIYTACDKELRLALTSIKVEDFLQKRWNWRAARFISPPGQVHKNWVIFPEKIKGRYAILHSLNPQIGIAFLDSLDFDGKTYIYSHYEREPKGAHWKWEGCVRGVGPTPIKTSEGWLIFYHAESRYEPGKYKVGVMLLDLEEPTKVIYTAKEPILEPTGLLYENNGFKPGVVYASGAVIKNGNLLIYYGSADSYVCVAYCNFEEFLAALKKEAKIELKKARILKRS